MIARAPSLTFGIEEEFHLVDRETRDVAVAPEAMMRDLQDHIGPQVGPEFLRSQIEVATQPLSSFKDARRELAQLRRIVIDIADQYGLALLASGTHPFAQPGETGTTDKERYKDLDRELAGAIRGLAVCGMHVHAGIEDDDLRIDLMNQARYFLPHLLTLSTSSPFWRGIDTGLKSYRLTVMSRLPRSGLPGLFASWGEYQRTLAVLINAGIIEDGSKIWWDLRPSARFPTLEMRICDVCPRIDDTLTITAAYLCILRMLWRRKRSNLKWRTYPISLIDENRWRAQRYGASGTLLDLSIGSLVPFANLAEELCELIAEDARALDCEREIANLREIATTGTSADRQLKTWKQALADGCDERDAFIAVIDQLVAETASPSTH
ncbi:carboxylate-amine ligase [Hyphomicrobium sp. CS1GBMeth3]|uniref:carboxylate-amine ligase n=1 Tax=Hyphomicrobium sp. CS1GBMeth3 TaxID=1892845 RepID=UPI000A3DAF33|nr:carboxylate-amine ligase [Hyphomicrobium sp. CS1GBMeth3]